MNTFTDIILDWYAANKRELPWRMTADPYKVWVSEIILQQTRVAQGYGYYLRFIGRFPDVQSLARANEDEVLKYWQGLGYYARARNLHRAARSMGDAFPATYEGVRALEGVGEYTAAAICSIAYGMPYAVVDGNVYRVLSRYWGIGLPIDTAGGRKHFAALAQELVDKSAPGTYNQAIMDFGALQCTPQLPACMSCPLGGGCVALAQGRVGSLPAKRHKAKVSGRYFNYMDVRTGAYTFINKRTGNDIWKNLFELPLLEVGRDLAEEEFLALPAFRALVRDAGGFEIRPVCRGIKHVLSHRVIYANFYSLSLPAGTEAFGSCLRIPLTERGKYAVPRLIHAFWEKYG